MSLSRLRALLKSPFAFPFLTALTASAGVQASASVAFDVNVANMGSRRAGDVLRTNVVAYVHESVPETVWDKFLTEQRVGDVMLDTVSITRDSRDLQDLKQRIKSIGSLVQRIVGAGGRVQLVFQNGIPKWLSSDPNNNGDLFQGGLSEGQKIWHSVPPSDFKRWEEVAYAFVKYFNKDLNTRGRVYYVIGSEPENYWVGNEEQWHKYYEYFVKGALRADPKAKIGGINTVGITARALTRSIPRQSGGKTTFDELPAAGSNGLVYNWLEFASRNKLPVDVVTWHDYPAPSPVPRKTANWVAFEKKVNSWLSRFGYSGAELILNDWPEWKPVPEENDSEFQAAYVVSSLISMIEDTKVKPLYLGIQDLGAYTDSKSKRQNASFGGGNGMFTTVGLAKPVYNAYTLMSKMEGRLVTVDTGDEFVRALASNDGDTVYVLLSNFIPSKRILTHNTYGVDPGSLAGTGKAALARAVKKSGKNKQQLLASILEGSTEVRDLDLPPDIAKKIEGSRDVYIAGKQRMGGPSSARIRLKGLGGSNWQVDEYMIDKRHANSYAARSKIMEKARAMGAKDKRSLRKVVEEANARTGADSGRTDRSAVRGQGGSIELETSLEPNSVHLIVLRKGR